MKKIILVIFLIAILSALFFIFNFKKENSELQKITVYGKTFNLEIVSGSGVVASCGISVITLSMTIESD